MIAHAPIRGKGAALTAPNKRDSAVKDRSPRPMPCGLGGVRPRHDDALAPDARSTVPSVEARTRPFNISAAHDKVSRMKQDTPKTAKRREREKKTISQMIAMHCAGIHPAESHTEQAFCGDPICPACAELDAYAVLRTQRCRKMDIKTSCEECGNHCYAPEMREKIRAAMRYSGPRMITKHPIAAVRHLLGK